MKKLLQLFAFSILLGNSINAQSQDVINLLKDWKFQTGDNMEYSKPGFDDSKWKTIYPGRFWEEQGVRDYNGYAWYRIKVVIPSKIKERAYYKDSLKFFLGVIDDADQAFLNGKQIGQTGWYPENFQKAIDEKSYQKLRRYAVSTKSPDILWDKENVIAVRVYDIWYGGGITSKPIDISMCDWTDSLKIDYQSNGFQRGVNDKIGKKVFLNNISKKIWEGTFSIDISIAESKKNVYKSNVVVSLKPNESKEISFYLEQQSDIATVRYSFIEKQTKIELFATEEMPYILTPPTAKTPRINGAKIFGCRPNNPFLFTIPATGERPIKFSAEGLPNGLNLDAVTGIITGKVTTKGEYKVKLSAENKLGKSVRDFKIVIGDQISLTPPMGWNSWNCWGLSVDDAKVRDCADYMVSSGLVNHGWTYVNIDDGWEAASRNAQGEILSNEKFPDMNKLSDYVHNKGLKLGIYTSPGPKTCGNYLGSYLHESQDAQTYGKWGIDYLKHDWCSYGDIATNMNIDELMRPYHNMRYALNEVPRDIVYSLCQYGMGSVWEWGNKVGGDLWRTTGDIVDTWESLSGIGFSQDVAAPYSQPSGFNDPDMLIVGWVGWGPNLHPTKLTTSEQYLHISLWALQSAPMLIGCDLTKLDGFTLNLLTNDEVIEIDQDILGKSAQVVYREGTVQIWSKDLEDGSKAVGIFNLGETPIKGQIKWSDIKVNGKQTVRDVWRQKDMGVFTDKFEATVPVHGVYLVKISPAK